MSRWKTRLLAGLAATAVAGGLGAIGLGAGSALGATHPNGVIVGSQVAPTKAGYFVSNDPAGFKYNQTTIYIRKAAEQIGNDGFSGTAYSPGDVIPVVPLGTGVPGDLGHTKFGAMGLISCDSHYAVDDGIILNNDGTFDVVFASGLLSSAPVAGCAKTGELTNMNTTFVTNAKVLLADVPQGHTILLRIARNNLFGGHHAGVRVEALDLSNGNDIGDREAGWSHTFTQEGAGVQVDPTCMTTSLDNELVAVRHNNVTDENGVTGNYGQVADWDAFQVVANDSAQVTYLSPKSSIKGSRFMVFGGDSVANCS